MAAKKKTDFDLLQGTWSVSALEMDGQPMGGIPAGACITVAGARFTTAGMGADYEGEMTVDASASPKRFDLLFQTGPEAGNRSLGIYELDGDSWKMCLTTRGGERPTKFATKAGTGHALQTLTRDGEAASKRSVKAGKSGDVAAPEGDAAPELDGEWGVEALVMNGQPLEAGMLSWGRRLTKGGEAQVMMGPQTVLDVRFAVERSHQPMWMNYVHKRGGAKQAGIYQLEGDVLTTCMGKPGGPRPDRFESKKGDGRTYGVWKRK